MGKTTGVSSVEEIRPSITTVARGRCTSAVAIVSAARFAVGAAHARLGAGVLFGRETTHEDIDHVGEVLPEAIRRSTSSG